MDNRIGFSTGALYKRCNAAEAIKIFKENGVSVLELAGFFGVDAIRAADEAAFAKLLQGFKYISLHAPKIEYGANKETKEFFDGINKINALRKLDLVVIHPDCVKDFNVFNEVDFPVAFENMDNQKASFQYPEEFKEIISSNDKFSVVLDINHIYTNDKTMKIGNDFHKEFEGRISQYHLSGFEVLHDPLFKTKQKNIIDAVLNKDIPIVIESVVASDEVKLELEYIKRELGE